MDTIMSAQNINDLVTAQLKDLARLVATGEINLDALHIALAQIHDGRLSEATYNLPQHPTRFQPQYPASPVLQLRPLDEQIEILHRIPLFAHLDPKKLYPSFLNSPNFKHSALLVEGQLAIPNWSLVANSYTDSIYQLLRWSDRITAPKNGLPINEKSLLLSAKTAQGIRDFRTTNDHFYTLDVQMGRRLAGLPLRVATNFLLDNEWPLDPYSLLIAYLSHCDMWQCEERRCGFNQPNLITELVCAGCRLEKDDNGKKSYHPLALSLKSETAWFNAHFVPNHGYNNRGYPTAFADNFHPHDEDLL